jgi:hypothetical protein
MATLDKPRRLLYWSGIAAVIAGICALLAAGVLLAVRAKRRRSSLR